VEEFPALSAERLGPHLEAVAALGALMVVHAEDAHVIAAAPSAKGPAYQAFLRSRPAAAEDTAIAGLVEQVRRTGARVHVLHLSSAQALPLLAAARADGLPITVETCPHYLVFAAEQIPDGATPFKCCPPIRDEGNRQALWAALADGVIDAVVSDHSPSTADLKCLDTGDFGAAWGGVASLQLGLAAVWTEARTRGFGLADVVRWMSAGPARVASVPGKGSLAAGFDADLVAFAPGESFVVDPAALQHKNAVTPYAGRTLTGVVRRTWLRGEPVDPTTPRGRFLTR
jgi:allantoinase